MNIVLLTSFYPPEIRSISTMMRELTEGLVERGHTVTVITPQPKDNLPDEEKGKSWPTLTQEGAVKVVRIKTLGQKTKNYVLRGLNELTLSFSYRRAIRKFAPDKIDGVMVYIPHFPLARVGAWVKQQYGARYLLNVQDIFPQNAIDAGIMKNKMLIRFYEYLEGKNYAEADALTTHTSGGREFLVKHKRVPLEKITTVYNWIDAETLKASNTGRFRKQYGLENKFIFLFAGIFGPTQGLELLIEVARRVRDLEDAHFLLVGEGTEKERLRNLALQYGLKNVTFGAFVSPGGYPALLAEVDVGLMCLAPENTTAVVPGKLFGYMAAGLPVGAFLQSASEGHRIIKEAQCGSSIVSDNFDQAEKLIRKLYVERFNLKEYGCRGKLYAIQHFDKQYCLDRLLKLITNRPH